MTTTSLHPISAGLARQGTQATSGRLAQYLTWLVTSCAFWSMPALQERSLLGKKRQPDIITCDIDIWVIVLARKARLGHPVGV